MEKETIECNPRWNNELACYVLEGIEYLEKQSKKATEYIHLIAEKTGIPPVLIASRGLSKSEDVRHLKIFYSWILENYVELARHEIVYFIDEDENVVHSFIDTHYQFLKFNKYQTDEGRRYFEVCQKIFPACQKDVSSLMRQKKQPFEIVLKIDQRPFLSTSVSEDFIAELVVRKVVKNLRTTKEILVSKSRQRLLIYGRCIFMSIMKDFFPKMPCRRVGGYVNKSDHASVLHGLRTHSNLIESKNQEYTRLYQSIYRACRNDLPVGDVNISSTVNGICEYLSDKKISLKTIKQVRDVLTEKLQSSYMFSRIGITKL